MLCVATPACAALVGADFDAVLGGESDLPAVCGAGCATGEVCAPTGCASECPATLLACSGVCVDTLADPKHCGACGNACAEGATCEAGKCSTATVTPTCPPDQGPCATGCCSCDQLDTNENPDNCGACGHSCLGGACTGGVCQPVMLADDAANKNVAVDGDWIYYYTHQIPGQDGASFELRRIPKAGGAHQLLTNLPDDGAVFGQLAFDATDVFFTNPYCSAGSPCLGYVPKTGGTALTVSNSGYADGIFPDGAKLFFTTRGRNWKFASIPKAGGDYATYDEGIAATGTWRSPLVADATRIFYVSATQSGAANVFSYPRAGGGRTPVLNISAPVQAMALHDGTLYVVSGWVDDEDDPFTITRKQLGVSGSTGLTSLPEVTAITADASGVYWLEVRTPLEVDLIHANALLEDPKVLVKNAPVAFAIATDDKAIYWTDFGDEATPNGRLMKLAK